MQEKILGAKMEPAAVQEYIARPEGTDHKELTYVEYRAVSDVLQNIEPPPWAPTPLPPHQRRGVHTRRGVRGMGVNILEDASHRIGLLQ